MFMPTPWSFFTPFRLQPVYELDHADDDGAVFFCDGDSVGDVIHVAVGDEEQIDFAGELVAFRIFRIVLDEGVDEDVGSFWGGDKDGGVSEPGDGRAFEVGHWVSFSARLWSHFRY
jgi:hypothetical protein